MTSQSFSQETHLIEKSDFSLLRLYTEQEVIVLCLIHSSVCFFYCLGN